jgi:protein-disulfide isomerase
MKFKRMGVLLLPVMMGCAVSERQIEKWVEKNPDKIMAAIVRYQTDQREANQPKPEMVKANGAELFGRAESPSLGSGKIEIAYFFDFNCGHCARQSQTINDVLAKTKNVKVIYKNLPVLGPSSELAAKAALAAHQQKKFKEFYGELYKLREKTPESLKKIAANLGLDVKKWEADMESESVLGEIHHVRQLADKMKIGGTPFLAIAPDRVFPGRVDGLMGVIESMSN